MLHYLSCHSDIYLCLHHDMVLLQPESANTVSLFIEQMSRLAENALILSLWHGGWLKKKSMHIASQHQLQLIAGTTDYRARLTGDLQSPGHYSTNNWQPPSLAAHVNPKTNAGFSSIHSAHDCGITSTPKAPQKSVNSPLLAGKKKPKCSKAAAE